MGGHEQRYEVRYSGQSFGFAWFNSEKDANDFRDLIASKDNGEIRYVVVDTRGDDI